MRWLVSQLAPQAALSYISRIDEKGPCRAFPYQSTQASRMPIEVTQTQFWTCGGHLDLLVSLFVPNRFVSIPFCSMAGRGVVLSHISLACNVWIWCVQLPGASRLLCCATSWLGSTHLLIVFASLKRPWVVFGVVPPRLVPRSAASRRRPVGISWRLYWGREALRKLTSCPQAAVDTVFHQLTLEPARVHVSSSPPQPSFKKPDPIDPCTPYPAQCPVLVMVLSWGVPTRWLRQPVLAWGFLFGAASKPHHSKYKSR
jgi:hypothetical protein